MFLTSQIYNFHFSGQAQTWFSVEAETYAEAVFKAQALRTDNFNEVEGLEVIGHNFDFVRIAGVWQEDEEGKVIGEINYETDLIDRSIVRSFLISTLEVCLKWLRTSNRRSYYKIKSRKQRIKNQEDFNRQKEM